MSAPQVLPDALSTWVEVRGEALATNLARVRAHAEVPVWAVVKGNGYGHGTAEAARVLADAGAEMLAVSRVDEARVVRAAGVTAPLLILEPGADAHAAVSLGAAFALDDPSLVPLLPEGARVHLKIDTGMGRFGIDPAAAVDAAAALDARGMLDGVMTHLANPALPGARGGVSAGVQLTRFREAVAAMRARGITVRAHAAASAGLLAHPRARFDAVRIGTLLYGQDPPGASAPWTHEPTFAWFARAASSRTLPAGSSVGYGSEHRLDRATRVATFPVGWADGFGTEVAARRPTARETAARVARAARAWRRDPRVVHLVAQPDGTPVDPPRPLAVLGRIAMQAVTVADPDGICPPGAICRIPARRLSVSAAIPRLVV